MAPSMRLSATFLTFLVPSIHRRGGSHLRSIMVEVRRDWLGSLAVEKRSLGGGQRAEANFMR